MKKIFSITLVLLFSASVLMAQETTEEFKPSGKPIVTIFSNAHSTFVDSTNTSAFEIQRAQFGYEYLYNKNFSGTILFDVCDPKSGEIQMDAFLRTAALTYKTDKILVNFGMIGLYEFKYQEKHWGNRYIMKSFQDEYKFGSTADLGISFEYKLSGFLSFDLTIVNGEGYKKVQSDDTYKAAVGVNVSPIKNFDFRVYYSIMKTDVTQNSYAFFAGYKTDKFMVGGEYNFQQNHDLIDKHDYSGLSLYSSLVLGKKTGIFGRFDYLTSETLKGAENSWNYDKDGQAYILGFEYAPIKGIKLSPNFRGWKPADDTKGFISSIYLNCEIKF